MKMNFKFMATILLATSMTAFNVSAQIQVSENELNRIENRLNAMSPIQLTNQRNMLIKEDKLLAMEQESTQNPARVKEIETRRASILSELSMLQKFLLLVGSAGILNEVLEDDKDKTPPVLSLNGSSSVTIELGSSYSDAGATADTGEAVSSSGSVDTNSVGIYTITYSATDRSGNVATPITRSVTVVDTTNPTLALNGTDETVELGATYTDAGATASDLSGAIDVITTGTVDTSAVGVYTLTYNASDASGNNADPVTRTVTVVDTTKPVVTVTGTNPATSELGATYTDEGATASDLSGDVTVVTTGTVDTATVGSYTLTYTSTDASGNAGTATRTVNVVDTTAPVFTSSATFSLNENTTSVGTSAATDLADITYSVSGSELSIGSSTGILSLVSAADYETKTSYTATVTASDGSNSTTQDITVTVVDVNDNAPVFTSSAAFSVIENNTAIGTVTATDVDTGSSGSFKSNPVTFSVSGSGVVITKEGVLTFSPAADYETKKSHVVVVTATDGANTTTQEVTITVIDANDNAPVFTSDPAFTIVENQTAVGTVTATDVDTGSTGAVKSDPVTYSVSGSEFAVNASSGVLTLATAADYETKTSYTATVTATDGTNSTTQDITLTIVDLNDNAPVFTSSAAFSVDENNTAIGTVTATDVDTGSSGSFKSNPVTYSVSGTELAVNATTGALSFITAADYETKTSYTATVTATDGTNAINQVITVTVNDLNDNAPVFTSAATASFDENATGVVMTVKATDVDTSSNNDFQSNPVRYSITGSTKFLINTSDGRILFKASPDYETQNVYNFTVVASDGVNSTNQDVTVNVVDVNDNAPVFKTTSISVNENNSVVGAIKATDVDTGSSGSFKSNPIKYSVAGSIFTIAENAGVLKFVSAPDYETQNSYSAVVTATDGTFSTSATITVVVVDVNDNAPVFKTTSCSVRENQTGICQVKATDVDTGSSGAFISSPITFTVAGSEFSISSSGYLSFVTAADYETKTSYTAAVTASDGVNSTTQNIAITVTNDSTDDGTKRNRYWNRYWNMELELEQVPGLEQVLEREQVTST